MKVWRGQPDNWSWKPSSTDKARLWLAFAGLFYVLALVTSPSNSPSAGRWAWLHHLSAKVFGPNGDIILYTIFGTACLVAASQHLQFSPAIEFRQHLGRFVVFAVLGALLGTVGVGFLLYLGPFLLICLLLYIVFTPSARERIATWGFLLGASVGFFASWAYLASRHT